MDKGYTISDFNNDLKNSKWLKEATSDHILNLLERPENMADFDEFLALIDKAPALKNLSAEDEKVTKDMLNSYHMMHTMDSLMGVTFLKGPIYKKAETRLSLEKMADKGYPNAQVAFGRFLMTREKKEMMVQNLAKAHDVFEKLKTNPLASKVELNMAEYYSEQSETKRKEIEKQQALFNTVKQQKER